jgi:hypothetical protein
MTSYRQPSLSYTKSCFDRHLQGPEKERLTPAPFATCPASGPLTSLSRGQHLISVGFDSERHHGTPFLPPVHPNPKARRLAIIRHNNNTPPPPPRRSPFSSSRTCVGTPTTHTHTTPNQPQERERGYGVDRCGEAARHGGGHDEMAGSQPPSGRGVVPCSCDRARQRQR